MERRAARTDRDPDVFLVRKKSIYPFSLPVFRTVCSAAKELLADNRSSYCTGTLYLSPARRQGSAAAAERQTLSRATLRQCSIGLLPRPEKYDGADDRRTERNDLVDPEIRAVFVKTDKVYAETEDTGKREIQSEYLAGVVLFV